MKKYIAALLVAGTLFGCQDFLEERVVTTLTQDYYKTADGLESLVRGTYQILRYKPDYNEGNYLFGVANDVEIFAWSDAHRIANGTYAPDAWNYDSSGTRMAPMMNSLIGDISGDWSIGCYPVVNRCNIFFENYEMLSDAEKEKLKARKGEMLFLRAYAYYLLSVQVGGCPIITKSMSGMPENFYFPKESLENVYIHIIEGLKETVDGNYLPETVPTTELGRITKPAAAHFLAKLYLNRAQAVQFKDHAEQTLSALYKGTYTTDLDDAIKYASMVIDQKKGETVYGGLAADFAELWKDVKGGDPYSRDLVKEILLSAQYEDTYTYNGRYGRNTCFIHEYNSNHTNFRAWTGRTIEYGRPFGAMCLTDWGYDMFTDRANDSRYYKTFLTDYVTTQQAAGGTKQWTELTAYVYNNFIKAAGDASVKDKEDLFKLPLGQRSIVYIENSKDKPLDSLWVASQPFVLNVRWTVGAPAGGYGNAGALSTEVTAGLTNPVITNKGSRKLYYRVDGDQGSNFSSYYGTTAAAHYMGARKFLDINRGNGSTANDGQTIDIVLFRLAETYLIRAEAYGRKGVMPSAIADLNVLRQRAAYHEGETRSDVLVKYEPAVMTSELTIPAAEQVAPYEVEQDSYEKIKITGEEWTPGTEKFKKENYPASTEVDYFVHFVHNERARELVFELTIWEDLHNAGILYERIVARDPMGAPSGSTGTEYFPFPTDDISTALTGTGKGVFERKHTFKAWPQKYLNLITDEKGNALDDAAKAAYQNHGY